MIRNEGGWYWRETQEVLDLIPFPFQFSQGQPWPSLFFKQSVLRAITTKGRLSPDGNTGKEEKLVGCDSPQLTNNPTGPVPGPLPFMGPGD